MIRMKGIKKRYRIGETVVKALDGVDLTVDEGEFVAIVGPSGSGKSTLMNIIGCLDVADRGEYDLDGLPIQAYSESKLAKIRSRKIGFVFQGFNLLGKMTAYENVELPLIYQRLPKTERENRVREALERVGLSDRLGHKPTELSGGQQQRVAIARALATRPALILADEPTGNLDSHTSAEIMELFEDLNQQGHTIVLITHDPGVAAHGRRLVGIMDGRIREDTGKKAVSA